MTKVGRNDPCPCGSGKKYKKCCLEKDEELVRQQHQELARVAAQLPDYPILDRPFLAEPWGEEELPVEELLLDFDELAATFEEDLAAGELDAETALEELAGIFEEVEDPRQWATAIGLLQQLRSLQPELYQANVGTCNFWLIEDAVRQKQPSLLPELLEPYARDPVEWLGELQEIMDLLMYHDYASALLPVLQEAWPIIRRSEISDSWVHERMIGRLTALTTFDYIEQTPEPRFDDPLLDQALRSIPGGNPEAARIVTARLLGQAATPWNIADFGEESDANIVWPNVLALLTEWLGDVHRHDGVALSKADLAREVLYEYLSERAGRGARGLQLLLPEQYGLADFLEGAVGIDLGGTYSVASLLELLPSYVRFLADRGLISDGEAAREAWELDEARNMVLNSMRLQGVDADVLADVERAEDAYRRELERPIEPTREWTGVLKELVAAGQHPKPALLDRIRAQGSAVVPDLIAMATDPSLHFAGQNSRAVWAPLHAIQLLGEMGAAEAIEPLLPLFAWDDDWLAAALPEAYGRIGGPALDAMRRLLQDRLHGTYTRARAGDALVKLVEYHPELRRDAIAALQACLDDAEGELEAGEELTAFVIGQLADLKAVEAETSIQRAFDEGRVDEFIIRPEDVERELGVPIS